MSKTLRGNQGGTQGTFRIADCGLGERRRSVVGYFERRGYSPPWQRRGGRASSKCPRSLKARTGWFGQLPINRWLERTTPSARAKVASRILLGRAATPPLPRRGICPHEIIANWTLNSKVVHYPPIQAGPPNPQS